MILKYSPDDPDVWYKVSTDEIGFEYYTYILVYVDDILILDKTPKKHMDMFEESYTVKLSIIVDSKVYIGADNGRVYHYDGSYKWVMKSKSYARETTKNRRKYLRKAINASIKNYQM